MSDSVAGLQFHKPRNVPKDGEEDNRDNVDYAREGAEPVSRVNHRHIPINGDRDREPDGPIERDLYEGQDPVE